MYTLEEINVAIDSYHKINHYQKTIDKLGYPTVGVLWQWVHGNIPKKTTITKSNKAKVKDSGLKKSVRWDCGYLNRKIRAVKMVNNGFSKDEISQKFNVSLGTIKKWITQYKNGEIMKDVPKIPVEGDGPIFEGVEDPEETIRLLKLENDIYRGVVDILKVKCLKEQSNQVKTRLIDYLRQEKSIPLKQLTDFLKISKSSYSYQHNAQLKPNKYAKERIVIKEIFYEHKCTRGYRFIKKELELREEPIIMSEKVVLRIMREENLRVIYNKKKRNYSSYAGEISEAPENLVQRNFHSELPNQLWLSDITQFTLPTFKVYLSPIIDCYDGKVVGHSISQHPDSKLANSSLEKAISQKNDNDSPICHTDRGCHYRWPGWIKLCDENNITRSMSKKACSPDNSACEGFFGRLKNEFFYYRDWKGITYKEFKRLLEDYIWYYNNTRKKEKLGWLSPNGYREKFLKVA